MDILQYKTKVFSVAEFYRGAGIKQSEWSKMMMPFFTLRLVVGGVNDENRNDFVEYFKTKQWDITITLSASIKIFTQYV